MATTRENLSPSLVLELLRRIGGIIKVRPAAVELPAGLSLTPIAEHEGRVLLQVLCVRVLPDLGRPHFSRSCDSQAHLSKAGFCFRCWK